MSTSRVNHRTLTARSLFTIVYSTAASAVLFSLGIVTDDALGLTPVVFLIAGLFFVLAVMTYVEGASLHQERGGSTIFARYAFNELVSFAVGWALLLDYIILLAAAALAATQYGEVFWPALGEGPVSVAVAIGAIAFVAVVNVIGLKPKRFRQITVVMMADVTLQLIVIALGLILVFSPDALTDASVLGGSPPWEDVLFALTVAAIAFLGLESASGLSGEVLVGARKLRTLVALGMTLTVALYVGTALIAVSVLPVERPGELTAAAIEAPAVALAGAYDPDWLGDVLRYVVGASAATVLFAAANSAMLGLSRLGYALATNRQIPSVVGRLHPTRATPFVLIAIAAVISAVLVLPQDIEVLVGIAAFGAMLAFMVAHLSVCVLRFREPDRRRMYRVPLSIRVAGASLPIPAVVGAVASLLGWVAVVVFHPPARYVGGAWLLAGLLLYVLYRRQGGISIFRRVRIPEQALRSERRREVFEYGSILVPIMGGALDVDIVQTAGRLAGNVPDEEEEIGATIEALWVLPVPMSLPIDAALPDDKLFEARAALKRAKAVGEEYDGVQVATAIVRARRPGQAIVDEARRRGVEAIVLAAEPPSRVRGGALLGGRGGPLDNFVGDVTKYVIKNAPCRVILTAPPAEVSEDPAPESPEPDGAEPDRTAPASDAAPAAEPDER